MASQRCTNYRVKYKSLRAGNWIEEYKGLVWLKSENRRELVNPGLNKMTDFIGKIGLGYRCY